MKGWARCVIATLFVATPATAVAAQAEPDPPPAPPAQVEDENGPDAGAEAPPPTDDATVEKGEGETTEAAADEDPEAPGTEEPPADGAEESATEESEPPATSEPEEPATDEPEEPAEPELPPEVQAAREVVQEQQQERVVEDGPDGVISTIAEADEALAPVFEPFDEVWQRWRDLNMLLDEKIGLSFAVAYTTVYQYATAGPINDAAVGDLDFNATWKGVRVEGWEGVLGIRTELRHRYGDAAPSELGPSFGSLWNTVSGFNSQEFLLSQIWWQQTFLDGRVVARGGKIFQSDFASAGKFTSSNFFFLNPAFASNPAIPYPEAGLGAVVTGWPLERLYLRGTFGDASARKDETDLAFGEIVEFFRSVELGVLTDIEGVGRGTYRFTAWGTDAREEQGTPSGRGFAVSMDQDIGEHYTPFLRYGYSDAGVTQVRQLLSAGVVVSSPFYEPDNLLGVAFAWGEPTDRTLRDQYVLEAFYRIQLTQNMQLTPDIQLIINPSRNAEEDLVAVLGLRFRVTF